jgi:hypothetical protein
MTIKSKKRALLAKNDIKAYKSAIVLFEAKKALFDFSLFFVNFREIYRMNLLSVALSVQK